MLSIFTYIFLFVFFSFLFILLNYYYKLFFSLNKNTYHRNEIVNLIEIFESEIRPFLEKQIYPTLIYFISTLCSIFIYFWSKLGSFGKYYTNSIENYFFHSFLIILFFILILLFLKDKYKFQNYSSIIKAIFSQKKIIIVSSSLSCISQNLTTYFIYQEFSIIFTLLNITILLAICLIISNDLILNLDINENDNDFYD